MDPITQLKELFSAFPGIGKRQAERFVYFLLRQDNAFATQLTNTIQELHKAVAMCESCQRFFTTTEALKTCKICRNPARDASLLLVVAHDVDLENIEKSGTYTGLYFVLGGTVPVLDKTPEEKIRIAKLKAYIKKQKPKEIILALSTNPEGEHTREYVSKQLAKLQKELSFTLTTLGRGLSTGAELEYSDPETLKAALAGRS